MVRHFFFFRDPEGYQAYEEGFSDTTESRSFDKKYPVKKQWDWPQEKFMNWDREADKKREAWEREKAEVKNSKKVFLQ